MGGAGCICMLLSMSSPTEFTKVRFGTSDIDLTQRGKSSIDLWVKAGSPTDSGTTFYSFHVPLLKYSNNVPRG